jgi:hypothetical protein
MEELDAALDRSLIGDALARRLRWPRYRAAEPIRVDVASGGPLAAHFRPVLEFG